MSQSTIAVLFSFALYALYVLLPVLPAVVIYRMFPKTRVAVSGPLSKLSFKASGAFAAYVVTVFLGYSLVNQSLQLIRNSDTGQGVAGTVRQEISRNGSPAGRASRV